MGAGPVNRLGLPGLLGPDSDAWFAGSGGGGSGTVAVGANGAGRPGAAGPPAAAGERRRRTRGAGARGRTAEATRSAAAGRTDVGDRRPQVSPPALEAGGPGIGRRGGDGGGIGARRGRGRAAHHLPDQLRDARLPGRQRLGLDQDLRGARPVAGPDQDLGQPALGGEERRVAIGRRPPGWPAIPAGGPARTGCGRAPPGRWPDWGTEPTPSGTGPPPRPPAPDRTGCGPGPPAAWPALADCPPGRCPR